MSTNQVHVAHPDIPVTVQHPDIAVTAPHPVIGGPDLSNMETPTIIHSGH